MYLEQLFSECLVEPRHAIAYKVSKRLAELYPDRAMVEGFDCEFLIEEYAEANLCALDRVESIHNQFLTNWSREGHTLKRAANAWFEVTWRGHALDVILMDWEDGCETHYWILAETLEMAENFFAAVCAWKPEVEGEVLVFEGGYWRSSESLFESIRAATFENLVLTETLKRELHDDLARFFRARELYDANAIPWKRGILLFGPPGNGKTQAVKVLVNAIGKPCLYVKSFVCENRVETTNIRFVFERARKMSPCIVVMEDLDSLVHKNSLSFFLNELDGFAANRGVAIVATTNNAEKLDPAILDRPSRFDRKFHFPLPEREERRAYLAHWSENLKLDIRLSETGLKQVVELTEGFSFAYLKELCLGSLLNWVSNVEPASLDSVMRAQAVALAKQMHCARASGLQSDEEDEEWDTDRFGVLPDDST